MSSTRHVRALARRTRSTLLAGAAVGALALVVPMSLASPAAAHDELLSTLPADGASVAAAPTEVSLTFGEEAQRLGTAVVVTDAAGKRLGDGPVVVDGPTVTQAITSPTAAGVVRVSYRVVSADGHPVTGTVSFTVTSAPTASETAASTTPTTPTTPRTPTTPTTDPGLGSPVAEEPSSGGGTALPRVLGGLAVLALGGAAVAATRGGRRGSSS